MKNWRKRVVCAHKGQSCPGNRVLYMCRTQQKKKKKAKKRKKIQIIIVIIINEMRNNVKYIYALELTLKYARYVGASIVFVFYVYSDSPALLFTYAIFSFFIFFLFSDNLYTHTQGILLQR